MPPKSGPSELELPPFQLGTGRKSKNYEKTSEDRKIECLNARVTAKTSLEQADSQIITLCVDCLNPGVDDLLEFPAGTNIAVFDIIASC